MNKIPQHIAFFKYLKYLVVIGVLSISITCVEPYQGEITANVNTLVVDAVITNELKNQEVKLTRSYGFNDLSVPLEEGAKVIVTTNTGTIYSFSEKSAGIYLSKIAFQAELNTQYQLIIETQDGETYRSSFMQLPIESTKIDAVYAARVERNATEGMGIFLNSFDNSSEDKYYRHEYEETFKIIAPFWSPYDAVFVIEGRNTIDIRILLREQEERVCYGTNYSNNTIIKTTNGLTEDRLKDFEIQFIDRDNYILSYRYSILVKQYAISPETFSFYETLKGLSQNSGSLLVQNQPGFLQGNIEADNENKNVAGFFEVSAVDSKRLFFNYEDFFPGEELPPYARGCLASAPTTNGEVGKRPLVNIIKEGSKRFFDYNRDRLYEGGPYIMVPAACGDCTVLGDNDKPAFWID